MENKESKIGKFVDYIAFLWVLGPFALPLLVILSPLIFVGCIVYYIKVLKPMIK
jgi:hypothetical protein